MKKMKKLFAILMTMAMVMGLSITGFAAQRNEATITVENATNAILKYVRIIGPDKTKPTGWTFINGATQFIAAFTEDGQDAPTEQQVIEMLIADAEGKQDYTSEIESALSSCATVLSTSLTMMNNPQKVTSAGLYLIVGTETNYNYSPMAAYVGFGEVTIDDEEYTYPSLMDAVVNAKKVPTTITKTSDDTNKITEINRTVDYAVTGTVPYVSDTNKHRYYKITDTIKGATYNLVNVQEGEQTVQRLQVRVTVGEEVQGKYLFDKTYNVVPENHEATGTEAAYQTFTLDLTNDLLYEKETATNKYANQVINITYSATVTDVLVGNDVIVGDGTNEGKDKYGSDGEDLVTAKVTFTKTDDGGQDAIKLNGATFVLTNGKTGNDLKYAQVSGSNGTYKFVKWLPVSEAKDDDGNFKNIVKLVTSGVDDDGNVLGNFTVAGLENNVNYKFEEIEAPEGYCLNNTAATINWDSFTDANTDNIPDDLGKELTGNSTLANSKLSALPSTGGMGTTLFTIAGCVIMISAAGLFFATRKKAN